MKTKSSSLLRTLVLGSLLIAAVPSYAFVSFNSEISDNVSQVASDLWTYEYGVTPKCFGNCGDTIKGIPVTDTMKVADFYLPYFADANIHAISSPSSWSATVENTDLFNLGNGAKCFIGLQMLLMP